MLGGLVSVKVDSRIATSAMLLPLCHRGAFGSNSSGSHGSCRVVPGYVHVLASGVAGTRCRLLYKVLVVDASWVQT